MRFRGYIVTATLAAASVAAHVHAAVIDADPSNYQSVVLGLAAGDTLRLAPGTYTQGLSLGGKSGTAAQPIVVSGPEDQSAVFTARNCCNTIQLEDTNYVRVLNLTLDAGTRDGSSGVNSRGHSDHITLENLVIVGHAGSVRTAGISTNGVASNWTIRHNTIVSTATGMQFKNAEGSESFVAGVIENNVLVDTRGRSMDLQSEATIVRHNLAVSAGADTQSTQPRIFAAAVMAAATPTVTLSASPTNVAAGGTSVLTWTSTDIAGCSASGGWTGTKGPSGSETVGPVQSSTSYQLTCLGAGGNAGAIVQVTVGGTSPPPTDPPMQPPPTNPPTTPPPSDPPTNPPTTPPPSDPPTNPPTTPPPSNPPINPPTMPPPSDPPTSPPPVMTPPPSAPAMNDMKSGGGSFDGLALLGLAIFAAARARRRG
jgi:hypothetical protein